MTGTKNKMRLRKKNSNSVAFRSQKARHPELEKRLCDYVDDEKTITDAQLLVKCAN